MQQPREITILTFLCLACAGCATNYVTPGSGVAMAAIAEDDLRTYYERQPASPFPASVVIVRVQDSGYVAETAQGYGHGRYTIVTTRDVEPDEAYERIAALCRC